ncbi:MAG: CopG family transcriptional regulator [Gemmatimonadales bacterium]
MKRTSLFLDDKLLRALKRAASRNGVSVAAIVREAVSRYLAAPAEAGNVPSIAARFASGFSDTSERAEDLLWRDPHA